MATLSKPSFSVVSVPASSVSSEGPSGFFISLRHVTLTLPSGRIVLNDLNESFGAELVGLVGRNGSGKSLLAKVLVDLVIPDSGRVFRSRAVTYVPQDVETIDRTTGDRITVADVVGLKPIFDALSRIESGDPKSTDWDLTEGRWDIRATLQRDLEESGLGYLRPDDSAYALSGGELTRVALIVAFLSASSALVLDEPTNHLDSTARRWLGEKIKAWHGGILVVSHDRELLDAMHRIVELTTSGLKTYGGNYALYKAQRDAEAQAAQSALEHARTERNTIQRNLQKLHDTQLRRAARNNQVGKAANISGFDRSYLKNRAESFAGREKHRHQDTRASLDDAVTRAAERVETPSAIALMLPSTEVSPGKRVLNLDEAVAPFPKHSHPLTLSLSGPVRIAISGSNGVGKTTLLKMLASICEPLSGICRTYVRSAWLDQHATSLLPPDRSVLERLRELETPIAEGLLRSHLSLLGLHNEHVQVRSDALSGGERLKAALACAIWGKEPAQLLLLDEPTNHLDLDSVLAVEHALKSYTGALVVVSHDVRFLESLELTHKLESNSNRWLLTTV